MQNYGSTELLVTNEKDSNLSIITSEQTEVKPVSAVRIENGYKSYGKLHVLKNLNLNVHKGSIYGLLGPSGCGN